MAKYRTIEEAVQDFGGDIIELDAFLFPNSWSLSLHQKWMYRKFERYPKRWLEANRGGAKSSTIGRYCAVKKAQAPGRKIVYSGPTYRQSKHPWRYERDLILESPFLLEELLKNPSETSDRSVTTFKNGSMSVALPASGTKIHGERATDLVLTEFFDYPKELYLRSVKPMRFGGKTSLRKTLTIETSAGFKHTFAYEMRNRVLQAIMSGDPSWCFLSISIDDLRETGFVSGEDLADIEEDREADQAIWNQQYRNIWMSVSGEFYTLDMVKRLELRSADILRAATPGYTFVAGLDVALGKSSTSADSAIVVWRIHRSPSVPPEIVYGKRWHGLLADVLAREVASILGRFDVSLLVMDFRGGGIAVFDKLRLEHGYVEIDDDLPGRRIIQSFPSTPSIINETHHALRAAFESGAVAVPSYPEHDDLVQVYNDVHLGLVQLADLQTKAMPSGYLSFGPPAHRRSDIAMGIVYGYCAVRQVMRPLIEAQRRERGSPIVGLETTLGPEDILASILLARDDL